MWYVRDEEHLQKRLVDVINTHRENKKYLPGVKISDNVLASDDAARVAAAADVILFAYATRHVTEILETVKGHLKKDVLFISFSKGLVAPEGKPQMSQADIWLVSEEIRRVTGVEAAVVSGAMTARGLAKGEFTEVTVGAISEQSAEETENLLLTWTADVATVEICGALKNILSVAAGIVDGLKLGANTKSAIIRLGLYEMGQYCHYMYGKYDTRQSTLLESCGVSELFKCMLRQSDLMPEVGDDWDIFNILIGRMLSEPEYSKLTVEQIEHKEDLHAALIDAPLRAVSTLHGCPSDLHPLPFLKYAYPDVEPSSCTHVNPSSFSLLARIISPLCCIEKMSSVLLLLCIVFVFLLRFCQIQMLRIERV
uniref:Glycerol-3-phosphate dehydrogenase [NAD(+)] n=1 Tax=Echinococcus granulosus TaxID=6210 RepID=A0A068WKA2_ECHGR|nr:glycerol 3 phosphate dehydrogenase [Echinococcus granulosus]